MATLNQAGILELLSSRGVEEHLVGAAAEVTTEVVRVAPHHSGAYGDSVRVGLPKIEPLVGVVVPIESTDPFWHLVEFGSVNNEAYAPLRRALVNLGLDVKDLPKP